MTSFARLGDAFEQTAQVRKISVMEWKSGLLKGDVSSYYSYFQMSEGNALSRRIRSEGLMRNV